MIRNEEIHENRLQRELVGAIRKKKAGKLDSSHLEEGRFTQITNIV